MPLIKSVQTVLQTAKWSQFGHNSRPEVLSNWAQGSWTLWTNGGSGLKDSVVVQSMSFSFIGRCLREGCRVDSWLKLVVSMFGNNAFR